MYTVIVLASKSNALTFVAAWSWCSRFSSWGAYPLWQLLKLADAIRNWWSTPAALHRRVHRALALIKSARVCLAHVECEHNNYLASWLAFCRVRHGRYLWSTVETDGDVAALGVSSARWYGPGHAAVRRTRTWAMHHLSPSSLES